MKKNTLLISLILLNFSVSAQIKGIIKDSISGKPISYVNIWVQNENIGSSSEENGEFSINTTPNKILIFSALGFENKIIKASEAKVVNLKPTAYQLDEVVIANLKRTKEIEIGDSNKRFYIPEPQVVPWFFARKFQVDENNQDINYIKEIDFFTKSQVDNGIFRARVYEVNDDSMPGKDLITDEIIVATKKGEHKTIVDISKYKIQIPKKGIVVAFESLLVKKNIYYDQGMSLKPKKKFKILNYAPHLMYFYNNKMESYNCRSGKWLHFSKEYNDKHNDLKVPIPAINLILTN